MTNRDRLERLQPTARQNVRDAKAMLMRMSAGEDVSHEELKDLEARIGAMQAALDAIECGNPLH